MPANPYKIYQKNKVNTSSGKGIEIAVLEMANSRLRSSRGSWKEGIFCRELDETLRFNQKIWDVFQADWAREDCSLPLELRKDLLSLSVFVRRTTFSMLGQPELGKLDSLIQINENLSKGLRGQSMQSRPASPKPQPASQAR
ncbi:MAG: flagellar biosynthesis regulator FlaF [Opitutales bacterium]|nr:flagellar biosynthesis regulator FlaF [Opitutales bacterium]